MCALFMQLTTTEGTTSCTTGNRIHTSIYVQYNNYNYIAISIIIVCPFIFTMWFLYL